MTSKAVIFFGPHGLSLDAVEYIWDAEWYISVVYEAASELEQNVERKKSKPLFPHPSIPNPKPVEGGKLELKSTDARDAHNLAGTA